jgi:hypothetical protein
MTFKLLSTGNPKTLKGESRGFMTYILHLAPASVSGVMNTCPKATHGCMAACLNTAGRGGMFKKGESTNMIQQARIRKTVFFKQNRTEFLTELANDIRKAIKQSAKLGMTPVFRLNGTSDISWEKYGIIDQFPEVQFYDYTKVLGRKVSHLKNYHLTFSAAESNQTDVKKAIEQGMNATVVFDSVPNEYLDRRVFDGDESDLRFLDPKNVVIGLKAKGKAKKDTTGFVVFLKKEK